jgi:hypothetical protein
MEARDVLAAEAACQSMERALATKVMATMRKRRINGRAKNSDATKG